MKLVQASRCSRAKRVAHVLHGNLPTKPRLLTWLSRLSRLLLSYVYKRGAVM